MVVPSFDDGVVVVVSSSSSGTGVVVDEVSFSTFVSLSNGTFGVVVVVFGLGTNRCALPIK